MRRLHVALDIAICDAYGWQDLDLEHDFYEVETLPENDRVRYTISPSARRKVLKRLLGENHAHAEAEAKNPTPRPNRGSRKRKAVAGPDLYQKRVLTGPRPLPLAKPLPKLELIPHRP